MASTPISRLIGPGLAGAAALLAAAVWLIPQRAFVPSAPPPEAPSNAAPLRPAYVPPAKEPRWPELAAKLDALREPWKGPDTAAADHTPTTPVDASLAWEYVGHVEGAGVHTAIVVINNIQRFVSEGESVTDPAYPGTPLVIKSITPDKIEVEHARNRPNDPKGDPGQGQSNNKVSTIKRKRAEPATLTPDAAHPPGSAELTALPVPGRSALSTESHAAPPNRPKPTIPLNTKPKPRGLPTQPPAGSPFPDPGAANPSTAPGPKQHIHP